MLTTVFIATCMLDFLNWENKGDILNDICRHVVNAVGNSLHSVCAIAMAVSAQFLAIDLVG